MGEILNKEQACEFLGISKTMLEKLMRNKEIPVHRIGKLAKFDKEELREWLLKK
jgi:excisionase family DNA binding protein